MHAQMYVTVLSLVILIGLGILVLLGGGYALVRRSQANVRRLRERGMYPQPGEESDEDVDRLLQHGHKIDAIKVYRAIYQVGLQEAKDAVEQRQRILGLH